MYQLAEEFRPHLETFLAELGEVAPERGDVEALRELGATAMAVLAARGPAYPEDFPGVACAGYETTAADGATIELRWYTPRAATPTGAAVLFLHGGGLVMGGLDESAAAAAAAVAATGVPFLAVGYRLAPEVTGEVPAGDAFAGLSWLRQRSAELGVDPARIAVMGESAGGGLAAAVAILARDRGIPLARQVLVYPMLDDRTVVANPALAELATWTYDANYTCWNALLGDDRGSDRVSPVCAPARLTDFAGLAPAYVEVGDLDIFRDEDIAYAQRLALAGVPVELHVFPGTQHGFENLAPEVGISRRALELRHAAVRDL